MTDARNGFLSLGFAGVSTKNVDSHNDSSTFFSILPSFGNHIVQSSLLAGRLHQADETQGDWVGFGRALRRSSAVQWFVRSVVISSYLGGAIGPARSSLRGKPPPSSAVSVSALSVSHSAINSGATI